MVVRHHASALCGPGGCYFLKFFFLVMFRMTSPASGAAPIAAGDNASSFVIYTLSYEGLVGSIIHPAAMLLLFLLPTAMLNQSTSYLKYVCTRFILHNRHSAEPGEARNMHL